MHACAHAFARARRRGCLSGTGRIWGYESACTVHLSVPCTIVRTYPFILHILHPWGLYTGYARMRRLLWVRARARTARRRRRDSSTSRLEGARQRSGRANGSCGERLPVCSRRCLKLSRNRRSKKGDVFVHPNCFCLRALNFSSASRICWFTRLSWSVCSNCIRVSFLKSSRNALSSESCLSTKRYKR